MSLKTYLDAQVARYETPAFIGDDPISFPHAFSERGDQEVIGLYAALLAWGRRSIIMNKLADLSERMRYQPYTFVRDFDPERDADALAGFKHRTFQPIDALYFTQALSSLLRKHDTLENVFATALTPESPHVGPAIQAFSDAMMTQVPDTPSRLQKHLARPSTGSACKRLAMYLRWMVRPGPVDLGLWTRIRPDQLLIPLDVHSGTQARNVGLLTRKQNDWRAALELRDACLALDPTDPARYDFALFGAGAYGEPLSVEAALRSDSADTSSPSA